MRIHILGICGTFMAGLAQILKESGNFITGSDIKFYPPMSDYLKKINITTTEGYSAELLPDADLYIIGNALSRGNESVEHILNNNLPYTSGPEILGRQLKKRNVYAITGTHGKTSTTYMLAHILRDQGLDIGFLVGGIAESFDNPAKLGTHKSFVIEADEYDSAFFDKRSKFVHYHPNNLIINNIEFDHADIFDNLNDIKKQFHHLIKIIPKSGNIIHFNEDKNTLDVLSKGSFCNLISIGKDQIKINSETKKIEHNGKIYSLIDLPLIGEHNFKNYVCAILAAQLEGINISDSIKSLKNFFGVKRRMELVANINGTQIYDDFAHHPTAIELTTKAIRDDNPDKKILGIIELGSNTMSSGYHKENIFNSFTSIDDTVILDFQKVYSGKNIFNSLEDLIIEIKKNINHYDIILLMTNKDSQKILKPIIENLER